MSKKKLRLSDFGRGSSEERQELPPGLESGEVQYLVTVPVQEGPAIEQFFVPLVFFREEPKEDEGAEPAIEARTSK